MNVQTILEQARDSMTIKRVFGEPYQQDGVTIVPVARIVGGAGGGGETTETGSGAGYGVSATPAGVYVLRDGDAFWRPAINVNQLMTGLQAIVIMALMIVRQIIRTRRAANAT